VAGAYVALAEAAPVALAEAAPDALAAGPRGLAAGALEALAAGPGTLAVAPDGLGALAEAADGGPQSGDDARQVADGGPQPDDDARQVDAVALAKSLLPTVGVPANEYNLPILEVDRYILDALVLLFFFNSIVSLKHADIHLSNLS